MADLFGANFTKSRAVPRERVEVTDWGGRVRAMYDSYAFTANPDNGDDLYFAKTPAGARILGGWLKTPAMGTAGSFTVGRGGTGNADNLLAATNVSSASFTRFNGSDVGAKFDDEVSWFVDLANGGSATSGTIEVCIFYTID
jgi:hypothetical protein